MTDPSSLMFMTLIAVAAIALAALLWFRRKPKNRHPLEYANPVEEKVVQAERHAEAGR